MGGGFKGIADPDLSRPQTDEMLEEGEVGVESNSEISSFSDWKNPTPVHKMREIIKKTQFCGVDKFSEWRILGTNFY